MAMLLAGYAWRRKLPGQAYNGLNVVGAVLLVVVCVAREVWPPAVLNVIWAVIGLRDMVCLARRARCAARDAQGVVR